MANLYSLYDNGTFESTIQAFLLLGYGNPAAPVNCGSVDLSNELVIQGTKSIRITTNGVNPAVTGGDKYAKSFNFRTPPAFGGLNSVSLVVGNYYEFKVKVSTTSTSPFATDDAMIFIGDINFVGRAGTAGITITDLGSGKYEITDSANNLKSVGYKVSALKDVIKELSYTWKEAVGNNANNFIFISILLINPPSAILPITVEQTLLAGKLFADDANLSPSAVPCDLAFDSPAYTKTDETNTGLNDGTVTLHAIHTTSGNTYTIEYSKDGTTWQLSPSFTGIPVGINTFYIRDNANSTRCINSTQITILGFNAPIIPAPPSGALQIDLKPVNSYNFVSWFNAAGGIGFNGYTCSNEYWDLPKSYRIVQQKHSHYFVLAQGEDFQFYINFDTPINYPNFSSLKIALVNEQGVVANDVGTLSKDSFANGTDYNIYGLINLSASYPEGYYRFVIYDFVTSGVLYISSDFQLMTPNNAAAYTCRLIYRNTYDIYNYYYSRITEFVHKLRMKFIFIEEQPETTIQQYRSVSSGRLRNVSFELDKWIKLESYYFDDNAIRGIYVFQMCDTININGKDYVLKEPYKTTWNVKRDINKGLIEFYEQQFSTANRFGKPSNLIIVGSDDPLLLGDSNARIKL